MAKIDGHLSVKEQQKLQAKIRAIQAVENSAAYDTTLNQICKLTDLAVSELADILADENQTAKTKLECIRLILSYAEKSKQYQLEERLERVESLLNGEPIDL